MEARLTWAERIRAALAENRFVLHAQPILGLGVEEDVTRYELLLRMVGDVGRPDPARHFPLCRRALRPGPGRSTAGSCARRSACSPRASAPAATLPQVNLSAKSIPDAEFTEFIAATPRRDRRRSDRAHLRGDRDGGDRERRPRQAVRRAAARARLQLRARRLRRRLRLLLLPQAPRVRLPEDRRRVHQEPALLRDRPAGRAIAGRRSPPAWASRRSPSSSATRRRSRSCASTGVDFAQGFHLGKPQPSRKWRMGLDGPDGDRRALSPDEVPSSARS